MPRASKRESSVESMVPFRITVVHPLPGVTLKLQRGARTQVRDVLAAVGSRLEARFEGVGRDGGPSCATVPLVEGWAVTLAAT